MARQELDLTLSWAAGEGWNPGLHDAEAFWAADPEGFLVAELADEVVGTGAIVRHGAEMGFMGLFIVREHHRGQGIGRQLWFKRRDLLLSRLAPGAHVAMDGVEQMLPFYESGGFRFSHTQTRFRAHVAARPAGSETIVDLRDLPFEKVSSFDQLHFGAKREDFLKIWIQPKEGAGRGLLDPSGSLVAMGVIRRGQEGHKIGPLFASTSEAAGVLFHDLLRESGAALVVLDVPTNNPKAMDLALRHEMVEVFSCGRMYLGHPPSLPWDCVYGNTSFELG
jgi:GNAT superfamily N-acetyltransferase